MKRNDQNFQLEDSSHTRVQDDLAAVSQPWTWTDVIWHYPDGSSATYPAYDKIDWNAQ